MIAFFGLYPFLYAALVNSPVSSEMVALLPRVQTMVTVFYFGLFAMSFDFVSGYTGYLSFGHAVFYGTGAYFVVLVSNGKTPALGSTAGLGTLAVLALALVVAFGYVVVRTETDTTTLATLGAGSVVVFLAVLATMAIGVQTPFMVLLLVAGLLAAFLAVLIGAVSFRLTGVYFAMITLGFAQVAYVFVRGWEFVSSNPQSGVAVLERTTGFQIGVPFVDPLNLAIGQLAGDELALGVLELSTTEVSYYLVGLVVALCYFAMQRIVHSPFGRVMIAIRENEERAAAVGYDTFRYKLGAFAISGFFAAVAGGLFAGYARAVSPENAFFFLVTGDALLAAIIGGFGTLAGPLYGRLFDEGVREFLSKAGGGGGLLPYLREHLSPATLQVELFDGLTVQEAIETFLNGHASLYLGLLFVLFVLFVPNGFLGTLRARVGGPLAKRLPAKVHAYWRGLRR